jgi:hypothetical protein
MVGSPSALGSGGTVDEVDAGWAVESRAESATEVAMREETQGCAASLGRGRGKGRG